MQYQFRAWTKWVLLIEKKPEENNLLHVYLQGPAHQSKSASKLYQRRDNNIQRGLYKKFKIILELLMNFEVLKQPYVNANQLSLFLFTGWQLVLTPDIIQSKLQYIRFSLLSSVHSPIVVDIALDIQCCR
jgi:hypothetical protein